MLILRRKKILGQSLIEYIFLFMIVMSAFMIFQRYFLRAVVGRWKGVGDAFGSGKLFDPGKTIECGYDFEHHHIWYNLTCYEIGCSEVCLEVGTDPTVCKDCILGCNIPECN